METTQNTTTETQENPANNKKEPFNPYQSISDFSSEQVYKLYLDNFRSYEQTALFIKEYYGVAVSRQAVYARVKRFIDEQEFIIAEMKDHAVEALSEAVEQKDDLKL